ncbi:uncharacterized protein HD556DRAFT_1312656 [Suillus plorans]|uniref:Uncharacterized protein n=1 Tax=Suillus plorans TaxID=116603 RepID=A0A9P7DCT8_9AGAM|nr:uncharacterized protein HD556DRAFT_1312656 [Suillus plorans]KAG1787625.1 hypothetical protein HD556DRAFT_1312656 [Suillus plorans]
MFTSRFNAIIALFAFLAGANASCSACDNTLEVDGVAVYTLANSTAETNGYTLCTYTNSKLGTKVTCEYSDAGIYQDGDELCPGKCKVFFEDSLLVSRINFTFSKRKLQAVPGPY